MYKKVQNEILLNNFTEKKKKLFKICYLNCMGGIVEASSETTATTSTFVLNSITILIKENIITKIKRSTGCST